MRPKLKMAVRPVGSNFIGARNNIYHRLLGRMDNTLINGEVARMIAEQVAAQVELRVKKLAEKKAAKKKKRKKESASLAGIVEDGDGKSVLSLKRSGVEIYCGEEGNTDVKVVL